MKIPFSTFAHLHAEIRQEMLQAFATCYDAGWFIQGAQCQQFEQEFAAYCGGAHCAGVGNGLDALFLTLRARGIGPGDEVIVPSHTFIATALAVVYAGASPVFCEVDPETYTIDPTRIEACITPKTRAIIAVHLYGQTADMEPICALCAKRGLFVLEDAAQAHGATYRGKRVGTLGNAAAFSFYPGKNLGALGDGGAVVTDHAALAQRIHALGCYGSREKYIHELAGVNSRLDELQAAFLRVKLKRLDAWTAERRRIAQAYLAGITNPKLTLPRVGADRDHVWHLFVIRCQERNRLQAHLKAHGIQTMIHYPVPMHLQKGLSSLGYGKGAFPIAEALADSVLSLPLYIGMKEDEIAYVCQTLNAF